MKVIVALYRAEDEHETLDSILSVAETHKIMYCYSTVAMRLKPSERDYAIYSTSEAVSIETNNGIPLPMQI